MHTWNKCEENRSRKKQTKQFEEKKNRTRSIPEPWRRWYGENTNTGSSPSSPLSLPQICSSCPTKWTPSPPQANRPPSLPPSSSFPPPLYQKQTKLIFEKITAQTTTTVIAANFSATEEAHKQNKKDCKTTARRTKSSSATARPRARGFLQLGQWCCFFFFSLEWWWWWWWEVQEGMDTGVEANV